MEDIVRINNLTVEAELDKSSRVLLDDISMNIKENSSFAIVGESGSGKTTLAMLIMHLASDNIHIKNGNIYFYEKDITNSKRMDRILGKEIVYVPQNGMEFLNPSITIKSHFVDAMKKNKINRSNYSKCMKDALTKVGLEDSEKILKSYPFELSGGMAQRVSIALALISNPSLLIADELTNGLDEKAKEEVISLIKNSFDKIAKIFITHDISLAKECDECLVLYKGKVMEKGPAKEVLENPKHPYTLSLINALVQNGMKVSSTNEAYVSECLYSTRCPFFDNEKCHQLSLRQRNLHYWRCNRD